MKNITEIRYPNTAEYPTQQYFRVKSETDRAGVDEIRYIMKSGEMSGIAWFEVVNHGKVIAEIKESVCDIYGEDISPGVADIPF